MNFTPKTSATLVAGALTTILIVELKRYGIEVGAEEAAAFGTILSTLASYFAPRSQPKPTQPES